MSIPPPFIERQTRRPKVFKRGGEALGTGELNRRGWHPAEQLPEQSCVSGIALDEEET
jgi:hypothetical protein